MPRYSLAIKPSAARELDSLSNTLFTRLDRKIRALAENPRPNGCKKLQGYKNYWRVRVGDYRIVYAIDDARLLVEVIRVRHRRDAYEF